MAAAGFVRNSLFPKARPRMEDGYYADDDDDDDDAIFDVVHHSPLSHRRPTTD